MGFRVCRRRLTASLVAGALALLVAACATPAPPTPEPTWDMRTPYVPPTLELIEVTPEPHAADPPLTPMPPPSSERRHDLYPPASQRAVLGHTYAIVTGHCGLDDTTDFDGSYWTITAMSDDPDGVAANSAQGTIVLESHDVAIFRSGRFVARLSRLVGVRWGRGCM